jgi:hypothetical protein
MVADLQVQVGGFVLHRAAKQIVNTQSHKQTPRKNALPDRT